MDKAPIKVSSKYVDFADVFSPKLATKLFEYVGINNHAIELVDNQKPFYNSIYSLSLVKLKILKIYIKNILANNFIRLFKSLTKASIFFDKKLNKSL